MSSTGGLVDLLVTPFSIRGLTVATGDDLMVTQRATDVFLSSRVRVQICPRDTIWTNGNLQSLWSLSATINDRESIRWVCGAIYLSPGPWIGRVQHGCQEQVSK